MTTALACWKSAYPKLIEKWPIKYPIESGCVIEELKIRIAIWLSDIDV